MDSHDSYLTHAMIGLLLHFDWTWVLLFSVEERESEQFIWDPKAEMILKGICVDFTAKVPAERQFVEENPDNFDNRIRLSSTNVYILHADMDNFYVINRETHLCVTWDKVWIMVANGDNVLNELKYMPSSVNGNLFFPHQMREIPGLQHYLKNTDPSKTRQTSTTLVIGFKRLTAQFLKFLLVESKTPHQIFP